MAGEHEFTMLLAGYSLAVTIVLLIMMSTRQSQPPTVVVQQMPNDPVTNGCAPLLFAIVLAVIALIVFFGWLAA